LLKYDHSRSLLYGSDFALAQVISRVGRGSFDLCLSVFVIRMTLKVLGGLPWNLGNFELSAIMGRPFCMYMCETGVSINRVQFSCN